MPAENCYYVYLLTSSNNKVMYVGVTNNLTRRVYEHQNKLVKGFTEKYNVNKLVYYEQTNDVIHRFDSGKRDQKMAPRKEKRLGRTAQSTLE